MRDDDLIMFAAEGAAPLPVANHEGYLEHERARIWYASYGEGAPIVLLHGGLGHAGNWGYQVPSLLAAHRHVVVIDSRGHGHSTRDERPYSYDLMATDVFAVMDTLSIERAALVGWSDGACIALAMAKHRPSRVAGVFFFACNVDASGVKEIADSPVLQRCFSRHTKDYARLSATPEGFSDLIKDVTLMQQTQPDYSSEDLASIRVPVTIAQSEHDEFIKREHAEYLAKTIPDAKHVFLKEVSHFAPLQRPEIFNAAVLAFVDGIFAQEVTD